MPTPESGGEEGHENMPKHVGIVAVSAEGAALCYRTVCVEGASVLGPHGHPEITMHTYPLSAYMRHIDAGRWEEVASMLLASAEKLRRAGACAASQECFPRLQDDRAAA